MILGATCPNVLMDKDAPDGQTGARGTCHEKQQVCLLLNNIYVNELLGKQQKRNWSVLPVLCHLYELIGGEKEKCVMIFWKLNG